MRYLYRVLRADEIKNNRIKTIDRREVNIESYVSKNDNYKDGLISMTCSLEYALGYCYKMYPNIPVENKRIAVIDITKLDRSALLDIQSISKYASVLTNNNKFFSYTLPPNAGDSRSGFHYSARAYEYLYLKNIDTDAYRIMTLEEIQGILYPVYNGKVLTDNEYNYPILYEDLEDLRGVYQLGSHIVSLRRKNGKLNTKTRLKLEWLCHHAMFSLLMGYYNNLEDFYLGIYGTNLNKDYYGNTDELDYLAKWYYRVTSSESYKIRTNIDYVLDNVFKGLYTPKPNAYFKEISMAVHERSEEMFKKESKKWINV